MADPNPPKSTEQAKPAAAVQAAPAAPAKTKVRALARGYYGGAIREVGDVFELAADADYGAWMDPISADDAKRLAAAMERVKKIRPSPQPSKDVRVTPATKAR